MAIQLALGNFTPDPPESGVKLLAIRPRGLTELLPPLCNWLAANESELETFWFSQAGNSDVDAIQVLTASGQITTIFREDAK